MPDPDRCPNAPFAARRLLNALPLLVAVLPAFAQYKVIGPDGRITYTDRPPIQGRVTAVNARGTAASAGSGAADAALPLELRQPVARYPVTLYTLSGACDPCSAARQLLRTRGVPYVEKQVISADDGEALERLSGGRDAPTLAIGTQYMRGLAPEVWGSYLDAAGYPRESRLPTGYVFPAPTPIVERREVAVGRGTAASAADGSPTVAARPAPTSPASQGGIKF